MTIKFTATIEVDVAKLGSSTDYPEIKENDEKLIKQLVEQEFKWVNGSGISLKKLKPIK